MVMKLSLATVLLLTATTFADPHSVKERSLTRHKRHLTLSIYLCGSPPNQFVSYYPCGPCLINCYTFTYVPPIIYALPPVTYPTIVSPGATQTQRCIGPCVNAQCPDGYYCNENNVCCAVSVG